MNYQNNLFTLLILLLSTVKSFSQTYSEVKEFHDNGQPRIKEIRNVDLKIIKKNTFDINGKLIEFTNYNPENGLKNGPFMEGSNTGFYENDKLNCENCTIVTNDDNDYFTIQFRGNFKDGKPIGEIQVYSLEEKQILQSDPYTSYLLSLDAKRRVNYSSYVGIGVYDEKKLYDIFYNDDGEIDGEIVLSEFSSIKFTNGKINEVYSLNKENKKIYKDSIGRYFKVLKINNKYHKNIGWLNNLYWNDFQGETEVSISYPDRYQSNPYDPKPKSYFEKDFNIFFGNENTDYIEGAPLVTFDLFGYDILNQNGLYQRPKNHEGWQYFSRHSFFTMLFFELPFQLIGDSVELLSTNDISDVIELWSNYNETLYSLIMVNGKDYIPNPTSTVAYGFPYKDLEDLKEVKTSEIYKTMMKFQSVGSKENRVPSGEEMGMRDIEFPFFIYWYNTLRDKSEVYNSYDICLEYYKILQNFIDSKESPITQVYLVDKKWDTYITYSNFHKLKIEETERKINEEKIKDDKVERKRIKEETERKIAVEKIKDERLLKESIILSSSNNPSFYFNLGVDNDQKGNIRLAKDYYLKTIELDPTYEPVYLNLVSLILQGETDLVKEMNGLGSSIDDNKRYDQLTKMRENLYLECVKILEKYILINGNNDEANQTLMNIYRVLGNNEGVKRMRKKILQ